MKGNYNPFHKTYQYLCFQQQKAHRKNLQTVKSKNQSNLKIMESQFSINMRNSNVKSCSQHQLVKSRIIQPHLVIHKNKPFQSKQNAKRIQENRRMAAKLMATSCSVITRDSSIKSYQNYKNYQQIARRYSRQGSRKNFLKIDLNSSIFSKKSSLHYSKKSTTPQTDFYDQMKDSNNFEHHLKPKYK